MKQRYFKVTKDARLAEHLLSFTASEQRMKLKGTTKNGYVKSTVLKQYFSNAELRKKYPEAEIERILDILVKAGLLEEDKKMRIRCPHCGAITEANVGATKMECERCDFPMNINYYPNCDGCNRGGNCLTNFGCGHLPPQASQ